MSKQNGDQIKHNWQNVRRTLLQVRYTRQLYCTIQWILLNVNSHVCFVYCSLLVEPKKLTISKTDRIHPSTLKNPDHHVHPSEQVWKIRQAFRLDGIPNILLKRLPSVAIEFMINIINVCVDSRYMLLSEIIQNIENHCSFETIKRHEMWCQLSSD